MQENAKKRNRWENSGRGRAAALKKQILASRIAFVLSLAVLVFSALFSALELRRLDRTVSPLVELGFDAIDRGDGALAAEVACRINGLVLSAEDRLSLVAGHRDVAELKRCAGELAALGRDAERDDYIACLCGLRTMLEMLLEGNLLTVRSIL